MQKMRFLFLLFILLVFNTASCRDQNDTALKEEMAKLRQDVLSLKQLEYDVKNLEREILAIRSQGNMPANPEAIKNVSFIPDGSHRDDPFLGPKDGKVIVMAFSDFQCHPCQKFFSESLPLLKADFIDPGLAKFIYRDFPVGSHPYALAAAQLAHCSGEQGMYWQMFSLLLEQQQTLDAGKIDTIKEMLAGADQEKLGRCLQSTKYEKEVERDAAEGKSLGAKGAPGFFVGREAERDEWRGVFIRGAQPYPVFKAEIAKLLAVDAGGGEKD